MSDNPYESPETVGYSSGQGRRVWVTLVRVLLAVAVLGVIVALLLPARRTVGEASRRTQCSNNLRQIALALQNYHDTFACLPPAYTVDAEGKPLHSWRTLILPFLEQKSLYDQLDLSEPWDHPANQALQEAKLAVYLCPSIQTRKKHTTYLAIVAPGGCFPPTKSRQLAEITDGTSETILIVEVDAENAVPWMSPSDASEELFLGMAESRRPPHPSGAQVAFVDGHVQLLPSKIEPTTRRALISIAGNEQIPDDF